MVDALRVGIVPESLLRDRSLFQKKKSINKDAFRKKNQ